MSRKSQANKRDISPDKMYGNVLVQKLIHKVMLSGKKTVASNIVHTAIDKAAKKIGKDPMLVLQTAIDNISPMLQLKSRRIGGANYQIPAEVSSDKKTILALQWLVAAAKKRSGMGMGDKLAAELIDAFNGAGGAVKKKEETHRMAEANRAFAHFSRF